MNLPWGSAALALVAATSIARADVAHLPPQRPSAPRSALAKPGLALELGAIAGGHVFSRSNELGVDDKPRPDSVRPSQRNAGLFGARVGVFFTDLFGVEGELGVIPTAARGLGYRVVDLTYRAHVVAQFRAGDPAHALIPFVVVGGGAFSVVSTDDSAVRGDNTRDIVKDTDSAFYVGAGAKLRLGGRMGVRADARLVIVPSVNNSDPPSPLTSKVTADFEALAAFYVALGR
jgi:opacity protein-like surface antigen